MKRWLAGSVLAILVGIGGSVCGAEGRSTELLTNPSFEAGGEAPAGWTAVGAGEWATGGSDGARSVSVTGEGEDATWWQADRAEVSGYLYHFSYWVRRDAGAEGGTSIAGLDSVNRDVQPSDRWEQRDFYFTPRFRGSDMPESIFRVGQWHVKGKVHFDQLSLRPALAVYAKPPELAAALRQTDRFEQTPLGTGERVVRGEYTAHHMLGGKGATHFRGLDHFTCRFNSNRWAFEGPADYVYYRHRVGVLDQTQGEVTVSVNRCEKGRLIVEAGGDYGDFVKIGEIDRTGTFAFPIPDRISADPAMGLYVGLRVAEESDIQVDDYIYRCRIGRLESVRRVVGETYYFTVMVATPGLRVNIGGLHGVGADRGEVEMYLNSDVKRQVRVSVSLGGEEARLEGGELVSLVPGVGRVIPLRMESTGSGEQKLTVACRDAESGELLWKAEGDLAVSALHDARGGELLGDQAELAVWWCEPERKVSRTRPAPKTRGEGILIQAAANEYEPAQLVVRPRQAIKGCRVEVEDLVAESGARIAASEVEVRVVEYVSVEHPTDELGRADEWPDPLPPHAEPMNLSPELNYPFWITVHVPAGTPGGDYLGAISIAGEGIAVQVPLKVHVWGFELPKETHVRSGFGLSEREIRRYHNLESEEEVARVHELYLRDFAAHRVAPYSFGGNIEVRWEKTDEGEVEPRIDFSRFDQAAKHAFDELGFNSFVLRLNGLGGGTFQGHRLGEIAGLQQGTPEHEKAFTKYVRAVETHLAERGWLDKAYIYWFDEPERKDYEFVAEGMELIRRAGPRLTRMLTTQPTPDLYGKVDLWCLPTFTLDPEVVRERQAAGEEIWWYLCTGPKAPYFTLFLDHYGTEMRLWLWETWKYDLSGILVWATNYWTSGAAYPAPRLQNPWKDPMSWRSSSGAAVGEKQPWGNGDGRFFYPPTGDPGRDSTKHLDKPIPSIRWESLRDGIEDYEYFWMLRAEIERLKKAGAEPSAYAEAEKLLEVPEEVCTDLTHFTTTPEPIHAHRVKLAEAIERLRAGRQ